ncbi:MAG TPA: protein kinase [Ktedonobacteraceae bacterium]|nr:protein kinase [Ktedonobacteraceae bacterium]
MADAPKTQGLRSRPTSSRTAQRDNVIGQTLYHGEYVIEAVLGQGGMGQVFLATHTMLRMPFALKQGRADEPIPEAVVKELDHTLQATDNIRHSSSPQMTESDFPTSGGTHTDRFLREALLLARLQHDALPTLYDYFLEDGYWYLVMDYIPGPTLSAYMHKYAPLPPLEALNYAMQLCDVLEYLHKQTPPVVFRDLKPSNIILTPEGRVTLVDFGIARYYKAGQLNDTAEFGSPGYAPPEQYQGGSQTDGRSDLYSLGVILHEMLSGKRPTNMGGKLESLHYLNPAISSVLSGLVVVATRTEPMYRFQSARTFYLALERAYSIEERRAYQNSILTAEHSGPAQWAFLQPFMAAQNQQAAALATVPQSQRTSIRESLQEARRERMEQEQAAIHLDSIDESLQHRSNMGIASKSLPIIDYGDLSDLDAEEEELLPRRSPGLPRLLKIAFFLALIVFVVLASLQVVGFFTSRASLVPLHQPTQVSQLTSTTTSTPAHTATVTAISGSLWQTLPSLPSPEADNTAMYVQIQGHGYIYMSGGFRGPKIKPHYDHSLYRYDIAAAHWETVVQNTFPGMVNNAVAQDEQHNLFFTIGFSSDSYAITSGLYQYQPTTGIIKKILTPSSMPIGFAAAMIADQHGHLYISQGFMSAGSSSGPAGNGWYRYDIATGQWHELAPMPVGLGYVVLSPDNAGGILLLGGATDSGQHAPSTSIYRYNIAQNTWTTEPSTAPVPLAGAASCLNGQNQLVIIGGYDAAHNQSLGQTWLVDTRTLNWTSASPLPSGGSFLGTAACDETGHVYLVRGANDPSQPTPDFSELTLP